MLVVWKLKAFSPMLPPLATTLLCPWWDVLVRCTEPAVRPPCSHLATTKYHCTFLFFFFLFLLKSNVKGSNRLDKWWLPRASRAPMTIMLSPGAREYATDYLFIVWVFILTSGESVRDVGGGGRGERRRGRCARGRGGWGVREVMREIEFAGCVWERFAWQSCKCVFCLHVSARRGFWLCFRCHLLLLLLLCSLPSLPYNVHTYVTLSPPSTFSHLRSPIHECVLHFIVCSSSFSISFFASLRLMTRSRS